MAFLNPYNIDFNSVDQIRAMSHDHISGTPETGRFKDRIDRGLRVFAWSMYNISDLPENPEYPDDYYGSQPVYPASRWGFDIFDNESDLLEIPNAEHDNTAGESGHLISIGSLNGSIGTNYDNFDGVDSQNKADIWQGDQQTGSPFTFPSLIDFIQYIIDGFQFSDAGCVYWAHNDDSLRTIKHLDTFGEDFGGTDIYNDRRDSEDNTMPRSGRGYQIEYWDKILKTGRRCWAFCEADRGQRGCNVLLMDEFTELEAQKAYREGRFYAKLDKRDTGLKFTKINDNGSQVEIETEGAQIIRIVTDRGVVATESGNSLTYTYPNDIIYLRVESFGPDFDENTFDFSPGPALGEEDNEFEWPVPNYDTGVRYEDEIYSQAIMFQDVYSAETTLAERFWNELPSRPFAKINEAWEKYQNALDLVNEQPAGQGAPEDESDVRNRLDMLARKIRGARNKVYFAAEII